MFAHGATPGGSWLGWLLPILTGGLPAALYLAGAVRFERSHRRRWNAGRTASFLAGCSLIAVALSPGIEHAAADDARGHMAQHLLLGMYAPLGLVLGAPITLLLAATPMPNRARVRARLGAPVVRVPTHLAVAGALNVGGLYLLYLTPLFALSTRSEVVHHLVHVHFLAAGYLFAWAIAGVDPSRHRVRMSWRIAALIAASGLHSFLAKLLYSRAPAWPPEAGLDAAELRDAAQWMYYGGHVAELLLLVALFAGWYRRAPRLAPARYSPAVGHVTGSRAFPGPTVAGHAPARENDHS